MKLKGTVLQPESLPPEHAKAHSKSVSCVNLKARAMKGVVMKGTLSEHRGRGNMKKTEMCRFTCSSQRQ